MNYNEECALHQLFVFYCFFFIVFNNTDGLLHDFRYILRVFEFDRSIGRNKRQKKRRPVEPCIMVLLLSWLLHRGRGSAGAIFATSV